MTRRALRENIFRILFRIEFNSMEEMEEQIQFFLDELGDVSPSDREYIIGKTKKILSLIDELDAVIETISEGWKIERIGKAELAILRLAIYEMKYDEDIPFKVAINEALELSKIYCNADTKSFINGLLAKIDE